MKHAALVSALFLAACATAPAQAQTAGCPPAGYDRPALDTLKANQWAIASDAARNAFARALTACLGHPDPVLRDGVAFEALQYYMRNNQLTPETLAALNTDLQAKLTAADSQGFQRPFAALVLSEVARTDRVSPWMTPAQRAQLLDASVTYLRGVTDYRGFMAGEGWRHGVAHAADLMLQLTLNAAYDKPELTRIRDAVAAQVAPAGHAYTFGESERLARPILYMARRNVFTAGEWTAWFGELAGDEASWEGTFASADKLARRHNLAAFASVIYIAADNESEDVYGALVAGATAMLRTLP